MKSGNAPQRPLMITLLVIFGTPILLMDLLYYVLEEYHPLIFLSSSWGIYFSSAFRFSCSMSYPISFIGLWKMHRWGIYLIVGTWLVQLIPSTISAIISGEGLFGQLISAAQLILYLFMVLPYWRFFRPVDTRRALQWFSISTLILHSVLFCLIVKQIW